MGRAIPCLIRIVAACPRLRLIRVCASYNKTFPEHEAFTLIQPRRRDPCSQDWPGTPQANGRSGCPWPPVRSLAAPCGPTVRPVGRDARSRPATAARWRPSFRSDLPGPSGAPRPLRPTPPADPSGRPLRPTPRASALPSPDMQTHRWPPDGQSVPPGQRCDLPDSPPSQESFNGPRSRSRPRRHRCSGSHSPLCCPRGGCPRRAPPGRVKGGSRGATPLAPRQRR